MMILLTGGSGFIGVKLHRALEAAGHTVLITSRSATGPRIVRADFTHDVEPGHWLPRLQGIEVVINAVGIIRETPGQCFDVIHSRAPRALFEACAQRSVRVIQLSALGVESASTPYFASKLRADDHLAALPIDWTIVRPSLVFGSGGTSARLFATLASLPVVVLPGRGEQRIQPIHSDDLVAAILQLLTTTAPRRQIVPLVGPRALSLREFLAELRAAMGLAAPRFINLPLAWMRAAARVCELTGVGLLTRDTLTMLQQGNVGDPAYTQQLLGRPPRPPQTFIEPHSGVAALAQLNWLLPLLRISLASMWIWTGVVSLGLYPLAASYRLLARVGTPEWAAPLLLYGAAGLDLAFGAATLWLRPRHWLWLAQMALIIFYTLLISARLPEFWLHPYGPIVKNLPVLAGIYLLYRYEPHA
jgi:uncharacterized protein YbjT (DUF2867 family)